MTLQFRLTDYENVCSEIMTLIENGHLDTWTIADKVQKRIKHTGQ
jgi:hypothetical protein